MAHLHGSGDRVGQLLRGRALGQRQFFLQLLFPWLVGRIDDPNDGLRIPPLWAIITRLTLTWIAGFGSR